MASQGGEIARGGGGSLSVADYRKETQSLEKFENPALRGPKAPSTNFLVTLSLYTRVVDPGPVSGRPQNILLRPDPKCKRMKKDKFN